MLSLTAVFAAWKALLLAVALGAAAGPDYDTSTSLFFDHVYGTAATVPALATRLTRWDALYFMHAARAGYVYEQDWAFGPGLPSLVSGLQSILRFLGLPAHGVLEPLLAIAVAHGSHLVAVLALYRLTVVVSNDRGLAYVASVLHILSPAGLFLSAPYNESPFACLSFVGNLLIAISLEGNSDGMKRNAAIVGAGVIFGVSAIFRSNGVLSGLLFAVEVVRCLLAFKDGPSPARLLRTVAPGIGGLCVAAGFVIPQAVAWKRYCGAEAHVVELRPWCTRLVPSIYGFVQEEYW